MVFDTIDELPDSVKKALPAEAQQIFLAAYNSIWQETGLRAGENMDNEMERLAFQWAWSAVVHHGNTN